MRGAKSALAVLALGLGGCLQMDEIITLFPDGSGKVEIRVALSKAYVEALARKVRAAGGTPPDVIGTVTAESFFAKSEGIVALRTGPRTEDEAWARSSATAYFEDVNKVRIAGDAEGPWDAWAFRATPGSLSLTNPFWNLERKYLQLVGADELEKVKIARTRLAAEIQGMRVSIRAVVPGAVTEAKGFTSKEASAAILSIDNELVTRYLEQPESGAGQRAKQIMSESELRVAWTGDAVDPARLAAWKAELTDAKIGQVRPASGLGSGGRPGGLGDDAAQFTDDEVDRLFIQAQLKIAREHLAREQKEKAREILQGILKDYPKAKAAQEAQKILDTLK